MFLVGVFISYFLSRAQSSKGAFQSAMFALTVNRLQIYVLNGNLVYTCFNLILIGLLLCGLYCVSHLLWVFSQDAGRSRSKLRGSSVMNTPCTVGRD
jgi:hypothetical protein